MAITAEERAYNRAYYMAHLDQFRAHQIVYAANHRDEKRIYDRAYHVGHRDQKLAASRARYADAAIREKQKACLVKKKYGITLAERDKLLDRQGGVCAICSSTNWGPRGPQIDHDHVTGKIRGVLCSKCNTALGLLGDNATRARRLADYLEAKCQP